MYGHSISDLVTICPELRFKRSYKVDYENSTKPDPVHVCFGRDHTVLRGVTRAALKYV